MISQQEHQSNLEKPIKRDEIDKLLTFEEILAYGIDRIKLPLVKI